ncbi:MAG: purine-binding chemotaxis protein CheW [Desulfuromonadales bacterium]|nr:purine-binding chemotaxis protein CheW [Desulfuromonadales bacterium]
MPEQPDRQKQRQPKAIDWDSLRRRLEASRSAVVLEQTPDATREILKARAGELARQTGEDVAGATLEVLEFLISYETYAIEISWIAEAYPLRELTPLPGTPPFVLGIINVRGRILSVIDIRTFFDLPHTGLTNLNKVIILQSGEMEFGILADEIIGTRSIPLAELQPPLPTLTGIREEYLKGVTRERTALLDGEKLLADRKIVVHDQVEA